MELGIYVNKTNISALPEEDGYLGRRRNG